MNKRKKRISYPKERAILSDVHPFETPITFSNRYFYRFLLKQKVEIKNGKLVFLNKHKGNLKKAVNVIVDILFNSTKENDTILNYKLSTIPFKYRISHKESEFRELSLIHPFNQLELVRFYDEYKYLILYYCTKSSYSIRKPVSVARLMYFNDKLHQSNKGSDSDFLELDGKEYKNLKTYFAYKQYTNIFQFYEDDLYHRSEKKFSFLKKMDLSKCFDSIYTHSISWAILGLPQVKEEVLKSKATFGGHFDRFIQYCNYAETNGIVIGPEFSRIFSEIILQEVDKKIKIQLESKNIYEGKDYEAYRYVDDFFIFFNEQKHIDYFTDSLNHIIRDYKLALNPRKAELIEKPLITPITIAKQKINDLFKIHPVLEINNKENKSTKEFEIIEELNIIFRLNNNELIVRFKQILYESKIKYSDILNYTLALLNSTLEKQINILHNLYSHFENRDHEEISENQDSLVELTNELKTYFWKFLDFTFFIYSTTIKVNSTIKTCHIISKIIDFLKVKKIDGDSRYNKNTTEYVFKKIIDETTNVLRKKSNNDFLQLESIYLLTAIKELGKDFRIPPRILKNYLNISFIDDDWEINNDSLDYFTIANILYYIGNITNYSIIKTKVLSYLSNYFNNFGVELYLKSSEAVHLMMDIFTCPFISTEYKKSLYCNFRNAKSQREINRRNLEVDCILEYNKYQKYWFTKWTSLDFQKELYNKKSQEVYAS